MNRFGVFLVGALCGGAVLVGVMLFRGEEGRGPPSDRPMPQPQTPVESGRRQEDPGPAPGPAPVAPIRPRASVETAEASAGTITGTVLKADGTPAEGALIRATERGKPGFGRFERERRGDGPPADASIESMSEEYARGLREERASRREATSDRDGRYTISGLGTGTYYVAAWLTGYEVQAKSRGRGAVKAGSIVDFVARTMVAVPVDVLLPDGTRPESAQISITTGHSGTSEYWRPAWGEIRCAPGNWSMQASSGDEQLLRSEKQDVVLKVGVAAEPLVFRLKARTVLKGRAVGVESERLEQLTVYAMRYIGEPPNDDRVIRQGTYTNVYAQADADFTFLDLEDGSYVLGAAWGHRSSDEVAKLAVRVLVEVKGLTRQDLVVPPDDSRAIVVWVLAPDGTPQPDVNLSLTTFSDANSSSTNSLRGTKRPDGSIRAPIPTSAKIAKGEKSLVVAQSERFGTKRAEVDLERDSTVTLKFDEPAILVVSVTNYVQSRLQGLVNVTLTQEAGTRSSYQQHGSRQLSAEGNQTFTAVQPGAYTVTLHVDSVKVVTVPATLVAGRNTVNVPIPPLHRVTVAAGEEHRGGQVSAREEKGDGWSQSRRVQEDGQVVFEAVPAGTYVFSLYSSKGRGRTKPLTISADAVVRFEDGEIKPVERSK